MFQPFVNLTHKIMHEDKIFIGADVSKLTIDFTLLLNDQVEHQCVENTVAALSSYLKAVKRRFKVKDASIYLGIENTGRYSWPALRAFSCGELKLHLLSPLHLSKSQGLVRGKSDLVDSQRIARFLKKNLDELSLYQKPREVIEELSLLLARRNKLQKLIKAESATIEEMGQVSKGRVRSFIIADSKKSVLALRKRLQMVELQIENLIAEDQDLKHKVKLLMSIPGVGKILSWYLLVKTNEFKNFDDPRKLACFAGVAPFQHTSGTSVRGRTRVSSFADKTLKRILHLAALRVTQMKGELGEYYRRKVEEGKNKMAVINALRNKIIHRIMAVIREDRPYQIREKNTLLVS